MAESYKNGAFKPAEHVGRKTETPVFPVVR